VHQSTTPSRQESAPILSLLVVFVCGSFRVIIQAIALICRSPFSALYPQFSGDFPGMLFSSSFFSSRISSCAIFRAISNNSQVAAAEDRCADRRTHTENRIRRGALVLAILCLSTLSGFATPVPPMAHPTGTRIALFSDPSVGTAVAVDTSGNLYIATTSGSVAKLAPGCSDLTCAVSVPTGLGQVNSSSIAVDANGNIFAGGLDSVSSVQEIVEIPLTGGSYGSAVLLYNSGTPTVSGIAVDGNGNLYAGVINASAIGSILKMPTTTGMQITNPTIIASGSTYAPQGIAVDLVGNIYIGNGYSQNVVKIPVSGSSYGIPVVIADTTLSPQLYPQGITVDGNQNVYFTDVDNGNVVEMPWTGSGYGDPNYLGSGWGLLSGLSADSRGDIYISNGQSVVELQTQVIKFGNVNAGSPSGSTSISFTFDTPGSLNSTTPYQVFLQGATGVGFVDAGTGSCSGASSYTQGATCTVNVTFTPKFAGVHFGAVTLNDTNGNVIATAPLTGTGQGSQIAFSPGTINELINTNGINDPNGVAVDGRGDVYVANGGDNTVTEFVAVGGVIPDAPTVRTLSTTGSFASPSGIAVDGSGNVYVADLGNHEVKEIVAVNGVIPDSPTIRPLGSGFANPCGVAVDASGNVYVADFNHSGVNEIVAVNGVIPDSPIINTMGSGFSHACGVAVDGSGNVYVADSGNNAVKQIVAVNGVIPSSPTINTLGSGFSDPQGLFLDAVGNLYVADSGSFVVKEIVAVNGVISSSSTINTVNTGAGQLNNPSGVAVDGNGNIYIADTRNSALKIFDRSDPPMLEFSNDIGATDTKSLTVLNVGNMDLHFPPPISGINPSITPGFTWDGAGSTTCPQIGTSSSQGVLSTGASCSISIGFTPASPANVTGTLLLTDDSLNITALGVGAATQSIALSGSGDAINPTITFAVPDHNLGDAPFTVSATSDSTGAFTYTVSSGPATISGATVTLTGIGKVSLKASEAAGGNYGTGSKKISFNVTAAATSPTITFTVPNHVVGDAPFPVGATSNSTGAFTYTVVSGPATISGSTVTLTGTGTVVLQASEAADSTYAAASQNATFTVTAITPTITFAVPDHTAGDAPFTVSATSNSTGAFTYTVVSGPATISGSTVTLTGAGTVVLQASQAANGNYAAKTASTSFTVTATMPVVPTLSFTPIAAQTFGSAPFTVSATSASSGAVTYAVVSGPATISGATVTLTGAGTVVLSASQAANGNYAAATATTSFVVNSGFTLAVGSGTGSSGASATATVAPGAAATFPLTFSLGGAATFPDALNLSATGLPPGATATFSPAVIPAGSAATPVTLTIQTSTQTARNEKPFTSGPLAPMALGFLLLPLAGMKTVRRRLRQIPQLTMVLAITLSLGVMLGLSGCGGKTPVVNPPATSYTVAVTATDTVTGAHSSVNITLNVQ
jgi:sugar lactone lactonase YvrE